ncbi:glycerol dehydrogenase [Xylocopilactobacillus apis]|uniref:Glycerol dehydrogenase n=1 Tax=Xylocopilactobacillus apis TaxID=2932183 RepID=A0AAU9CX89_9LACO|nr:glycerol dehydrogenase [Xylocopilactobacillus apis]BDR55918.1 glycerol dehydrogenase [Xylocopilactobacillus apis]
MAKIFTSPSTYIQGSGMLLKSAQYFQKYGKRILILADDNVLNIIGKKFSDYLAGNGFEIQIVLFSGESSVNEINRISAIAKEKQSEIIIGLGGGKTIDCAKGVADNLNTTLIIAPTTASTDAPCSRISVLYKEDGLMDHYRYYNRNPEVVLVDTRVIVGAPVSLLISGIADALATNVELNDIYQAQSNNMVLGQQTIAARAIGQACEETLFVSAKLAIAANKAHVVTESFERVVDANTLLSGLGFESGGLAAAHAVHNSFTALKGDVHKLSHGQKVAFGTLVELILNGSSVKRFEKFLKFDLELGLPTTLADLHLEDVSNEELMKAASLSCSENDTMGRMPGIIKPEDVFAAIKTVDEYSCEYQEKV